MLWAELIILILTAALLSAAYYVYRVIFYTPAKGQNDPFRPIPSPQHEAVKELSLKMIADVNSIEYEEVCITSFDGLKLYGRYYHKNDDAPFAVCMHGYRGVSVRDFSGGARFLIDEGQNVLLVAQRGHAKSEGHSITFGFKEKYDCAAWIDYVVSRFGKDKKIALYGISMGAATVLMASELKLPENVKCIIADCPYSSPKAIITRAASDRGYNVKLIYPLIWLASRLFARFDINASGAVDAVKRAKVPILILHGEDDRFVPCEMSRQIAAAAPELVRLETFPNAGHGLSFVIDRGRYVSVVREFLKKSHLA